MNTCVIWGTRAANVTCRFILFSIHPLQLNSSPNISTGVVNDSIVGVVYSDNKLAIYQLDKVLLPLDFFKTKAPALASSLAATAKAPKAAKENSSSSSSDDQDDKDQGNKFGTEIVWISWNNVGVSCCHNDVKLMNGFHFEAAYLV
ncbi:fasciclin-like arabinogalactan protein, partial [Trifolium medium]|nr:fasciclin-like arabinogalactan protein [Trifolium medium]